MVADCRPLASCRLDGKAAPKVQRMRMVLPGRIENEAFPVGAAILGLQPPLGISAFVVEEHEIGFGQQIPCFPPE